MTSNKSEFRADSSFRILHLLEENPELSQRQLADALGFGLGSAHYLLRAFVDKGFIKLGNFTAAKDKRRYAYILTPRGMREKTATTKKFLARKLSEYKALKQEIAELRDLLRADPGAQYSRPTSKAVGVK